MIPGFSQDFLKRNELKQPQAFVGHHTYRLGKAFISHPIHIFGQTQTPLSPKLGKLTHATQISYSTYLSGNALHKFNTLHKFSALRKGNTYHANIVLHNTPHIVALGYLQGERIPELHRLSWQCLDNTLKLEIGMLNPHTCVGTHSTKLTHTVQTLYST